MKMRENVFVMRVKMRVNLMVTCDQTKMRGNELDGNEYVKGKKKEMENDLVTSE